LACSPTEEMKKQYAQLTKTKDPYIGTEEPIRDEILRQGDQNFHVLSCIQFENRYWKDCDTQLVTFWMPASLFKKYKNYYVSVIRTDSWCRLNGLEVVVQLRDARRLT